MQSASQAHLKRLAKLAQKKHRHAEGKLLAEGLHLAQEALAHAAQAGFLVHEIFTTAEGRANPEAQQLIKQADVKKIPVFDVAQRAFNAFCDTDNPQGVAAVLSFEAKQLPSGFTLPKGLAIYADRIQDPGNLGSLMRSCAAFQCPALLLGEGTVDWTNSKAVRASMGAVFKVPIYEVSAPQIAAMAQSGTPLIAADARGATSCYDYLFPKRAILLIGNEAGGLQQALLDAATVRLKIPMADTTESLNSSVSAAILLSLHYAHR